MVVLLVVNAIGFGAASWYYSGRIGSDALAVHQPGPWSEDLQVAAVAPSGDPASATISVSARPGVDATEATTQLRSVKVYGLNWQGGFAQSFGAASVAGTTLTRKATLIEGSWPTVGEAIGVQSFAFPRGPRAPQEQVTYPGPAGQLGGYLTRASIGDSPTAPADTWAILVHGKGVTPDEFDRMTPTFLAAGMTTLAIEYRGDPGQPAEPRNQYGFGTSEWPDLAAAVNYARGQGARHVVLMGASMGGAIVASYLRQAQGTEIVEGVVLDSPALDLSRVVQWGADQIALPGGIPLPTPITWAAERIATARFGVDWTATNYLADPSWDRLPTLVFHGTADLTVPNSISRDLAQARPNVTLVQVPGADHVESWNVDPAAYEGRLSTFLATVTGPRD